MRNRLIHLLLFLLVGGSLGLHVWEYCKIRDFSQTFLTQAEIEAKRTALLVLQQSVIQNMARQIDALTRAGRETPLELNWEKKP